MATAQPPQYTLPLLTPIRDLLISISGPLPIPYLSLPLSFVVLLHALRVSYAACQVQGYPYPSSSKSKASPPSIFKSVTLVWILLFGGWSLLAALLAQPSPLLILDVHVSGLVYGVVHVLCLTTGISEVLVRIGETRIGGLSLDIISIFVDAICRTEGITALGVDSLSGTYLGGLSPLTLLVAPTLIGGGGPLLIGLFNLASPTGDWKLLNPPDWIRDPWQLGAIDIWSSTLIGGLYALLSGDGNGNPISFFTSQGSKGPLLEKDEARLFLSVLLFLLLAGNRLRSHFGVGEEIAVQKKTTVVAKKGKKDAVVEEPSSPSSSKGSLLLSVGLALPLLLVGLQYLLAGNDFLERQGWVSRIGSDAFGQ